MFTLHTGRTFSLATEGLWKSRALGGRDMCIPPFKKPSMDVDSLRHKDIMRDGYRPKMLLFTLDELFYIYDQIKKQRRADEKIIVAYEILCLSVNWCTNRWHGMQKTGMPDAFALLNVDDTHHFECLTWAVYDGALLVGLWPKLPGDRPCCTVLAGLHKHIYRGRDDAAHCPPHMLGSWDCQERIEVLHRGGRLSSMQGGRRRASQPRRRSQSSSQCHSETPAQGNRDGHSCRSSPHTPLRSHRKVTTSPCIPLRCYCRATASPNASTMPKLASAVNVLSHARSSHSGEGMARASLDDDDTWDDDFQTPHTPVHRVVWREDDGRGEPVDGRMESSSRSPGWQTGYQVDIGEEEATLETIDPTWRTSRWLQLVVQGILDDKVPWYDFIIPLMVGTEGMALSLAKHLLAVWRWSIKVQGWDVCPPAPTALNIRQFMTREEVLEGVDDPLWFVAYSRTLQWVGEVAC